MNEYKRKQEERRERYLERAEKAEGEARAKFAAEHRIVDGIPLGQPILIGHHSEKRHRRDIARADSLRRNGIDALDKAAHYRDRADGVGRAGISSDDPDAIDKLREKLAVLEARQARSKAINAAHVRYLKNPATLETANLADDEKIMIRNYKPAYSWEPHPFAPYQFQNLGATIRSVRERIERLAAQDERETKETEDDLTGMRMVQNAEANRVQIFFPGKPEEAVRGELKHRGFRWSPTEGAWQRHLNNGGIYAADSFMEWLRARGGVES